LVKTVVAVVGLIVALGMWVPARAAVQPLEEGYWLLHWDLTADKEAPLADLLKAQTADSVWQAVGVQIEAPTPDNFDVAAAIAIGNRLQASYPGKLILITPTVGTEGWEDSFYVHDGLSPLSKSDRPQPQTQAQWLKRLEAYQGDKVGLVVPRVQSPEVVAPKVAAYVKNFAKWCCDHGKTCFVFISARDLTGPAGEALAKTVAQGAGKLVDRWVWTDAAGIVYGSKELDEPALLKKICALTPREQTALAFAAGGEWVDTPALAGEFMARAQAAGINRFAMQGEPEDMSVGGWSSFFKGLSIVVMPPPCSPLPGHG
jgi:hypothetical protein